MNMLGPRYAHLVSEKTEGISGTVENDSKAGKAYNYLATSISSTEYSEI